MHYEGIATEVIHANHDGASVKKPASWNNLITEATFTLHFEHLWSASNHLQFPPFFPPSSFLLPLSLFSFPLILSGQALARLLFLFFFLF
jgi:hypothetical protein